MDKYFIALHNGNIAISRCENGAYVSIKKEGEDEQPYHPSEFWEWFKEKVDYDDEALSFIVVCDVDTFTIAKEIRLAKTNAFTNDASCLSKIEKYQNMFTLLSFPKIEKLDIRKKSHPKKSKTPKKEMKIITNTTIADIYTKETMEYKND